jgi:hypothetical protein
MDYILKTYQTKLTIKQKNIIKRFKAMVHLLIQSSITPINIEQLINEIHQMNKDLEFLHPKKKGKIVTRKKINRVVGKELRKRRTQERKYIIKTLKRIRNTHISMMK